MLASEEDLMKVHKSQWLLTSCLALKSLGKPCTRAHTMVSGVQTPLRCPDTGRPPREVLLQGLENKALSRGIIGKSAPLLAEITIRKSQNNARHARHWRPWLS